MVSRSLLLTLLAAAPLMACASPSSAGLIHRSATVIKCPIGGSGGADGCGGQGPNGNFINPTWQATAIENGASTNLSALATPWNIAGVSPGYAIGYNAATLIPASQYHAVVPQCVYTGPNTGMGGGGQGNSALLTCNAFSSTWDGQLNNLDLTEGGTTCTQLVLGQQLNIVSHVLTMNNIRVQNSDACGSPGDSSDNQQLIFLPFQNQGTLTAVNMTNYYVDGNPAGCVHCTDPAYTINAVFNSNARALTMTFEYGVTLNLPNRFANITNANYVVKYNYIGDFSLSQGFGGHDHGEWIQSRQFTPFGATQTVMYNTFTLSTNAAYDSINTPIYLNGTPGVDFTVSLTPDVENNFFITNPSMHLGAYSAARAGWSLQDNFFPSATFKNNYFYAAGALQCSDVANGIGGANPGVDSPTFVGNINLFNLTAITGYDSINSVPAGAGCAGHGHT